MSSIPFVCFDTTITTLRQMADELVFVASGDTDRTKPVDRRSIVGRYGRSDQALDGNERNIELPGFTVTYLGMSGGPSSGSICHDDRVVRLLVQLIDSTDGNDHPNVQTYFRWMTDVREWLQQNPYNPVDDTIGNVYLVHVTEESLPDEEKWALDREMRMYSVINCFARMRRTKGQSRWQSR